LCALLLSLGFALAGAAYAQAPAPNAPLTSEEIARELAGTRMTGVTLYGGEPWSECIAPDWTTTYEFRNQTLAGRGWTEPPGRVCFQYDLDPQLGAFCFRVTRNGRNYIFWGGEGGVFTSTDVLRGVTSCAVPASGPVS
jgi:hypothetical protein